MDLPYLTADLPGTGGLLRAAPEDFRVDEIPAYPLEGEGDHVWFKLRKRGIDTFEAVRRIASALDLKERAFSYAGLKDGRAVTTQWMSCEQVTPGQLDELEIPRLEILEITRHRNRIKLGHLRGNRFDLAVRKAHPDFEPRARAILEVLVRRGAPNYFGQQRFGARLNSHRCGEAILREDYDAFVRELIGRPSPRERDMYLKRARQLFEAGKLEQAYEAMPIRQRAEKKALHALLRFKDPERAYFSIPRRMRQMFLSAYQSHLFNEVAKRRLAGLDRIEPGDLAFLHRNGAVFAVEKAELEAARRRCAAFEISPSGPIYGTKAILADGPPGKIEHAVLAEAGLTRGSFAVGGGLSAPGNRRSLRLPVRDLSFAALGPTAYRIRFSLPPGSYATSLMRELMKADRAG